MTKVSNVHIQAQQLLEDCGLDEITNIEIGLLVAWLDAILIEEELTNCDGKIIPGKNKVIIKVRSSIQFEQRKRFVIAHEIGHLILHRNIQLHDDIFSNFNIFEGMENALKNGKQELEANEFASELLMPQKLFLQEAKGEKSGQIEHLGVEFFRHLKQCLPSTLALTDVIFWRNKVG